MKTSWKVISYLGTAIGGFVAGNISTAFEIFRWYESQPAYIVGEVAKPLSGLRVLLDGPEQTELADPNIGRFRFDNVIVGTHTLLFQHPSFGEFSTSLRIDTPGEHVLTAKFELPPSRKENTRVGPEVKVAAVRHSEDGADPLAMYAAKLPPAVLDESKKQVVTEGWVYFERDAANANLQLVKLKEGQFTELVKAALVRESRPTEEKGANGYMLGKPVGVIQPGQTVQVQDYLVIKGEGKGADSIWADVKVVGRPPDS